MRYLKRIFETIFGFILLIPLIVIGIIVSIFDSNLGKLIGEIPFYLIIKE